MWEDKVLHDPDGVNVAAIFEDVHSDDLHEQYEAATGLYWVGDLRPERLRPRRDELFGLLGDLPDYGLSDNDHFGTRRWVTEAVAEYVSEYPTDVLDVFDLLDSGDRRTREDALLVLRFCLGARPNKFVEDDAKRAELLSPLAERFEQLTVYLDADNPTIQASVLVVLADLAHSRPAEAAGLLDRMCSFLETPSTVRPYAVFFLREVSLAEPETANVVTERLTELLRQLATANPLELPASDLHSLMVTLQALATLAPECPECAKSVERILERW